MRAAKDRFIQLKFLHRTYYTSHRMASIYPQLDLFCLRCRSEVETFWHMVGSCPKLQSYWEEVARTLSELSNAQIPLEPLVLLLSYLEEVEEERYVNLCITFSLIYARREIILKWKSVEPPTPDSWRKSVNSLLPLYRTTYESRQCPGKFDKVWIAWIDACG